MCDNARSAGTVYKTKAQLRRLKREHPSYWKTDDELAKESSRRARSSRPHPVGKALRPAESEGDACKHCGGKIVSRGKVGYGSNNQEQEADWEECEKCGKPAESEAK